MEFKEEFEKAQEVIKKAGKLLLKSYNKNLTVSFKTDAAWVTKVDKQTEKFIYESLKSAFTNYGFIGEEGTMDSEKDLCWIVDPLDGTIAYTRHIPEFGIAIAFKKGKEVIFSVQYIPFYDLLLTAYKGQGAYCNGEPLQLTERKGVYQLFISIKAQMFWWEQFKDYTVKMVKPNRFRVADSSVVESYYLTANKIDVFARFNQPIWDTAAECLLMEEAGAIIRDEYNKPLELEFTKTARYNIIATNSFINKKFNTIIYMKKTF